MRVVPARNAARQIEAKFLLLRKRPGLLRIAAAENPLALQKGAPACMALSLPHASTA
jgi:hypothetical protein